MAAYRNQKEAYAGCAVLSAWLTLPDASTVGKAKQTPLFWGHGKFDDKVLFPQQKFGVEKLREEGVNITDKSYDMGHSSHPDEMKDFALFVDSCLFKSDGNADKEL